MGIKVTDLDRAIAKKIREFREQAKLTQSNVAGHLGITYQSYQKMERGCHAFRASTLDRLAQLYNKRLFEFMGDGELTIDPAITRATLILHGMSDDDREAAIRALLHIKHGEKAE
jgi:transcriptional regulator with XRE-family HTH domain